jgi:glycosyltransferase involved in cell wall biosynthesis
VRIDQFVPTFVKHDAISNHVLQVRRALREAGYDSDVYAENLDPRLAREARPYADCDPTPDAGRVILYHGSTDSPMAAWLEAAGAAGQRLAGDYHNITPSRYFARWEPVAARSMARARQELARLAPLTGLAVADSAFNRAELDEMGYRRTAVCPLLVDLEEYHQEPDPKLAARLRRRREGLGTLGRHWLFVGRIAPNKCQHDVIAAFAIYRRLFDPEAHLTLVGGPTSLRYLRAVDQMTAQLELGDHVEIRSDVPFTQIIAYFSDADVLVCLSEHEGFCVPILEAMELGLPVVAYQAAAVTDTVGSAGVLLDDKDPLVVACAVDDLLGDAARRANLVAAGRARAAEFSLESAARCFLYTLTTWLAETHPGPERSLT